MVTDVAASPFCNPIAALFRKLCCRLLKYICHRTNDVDEIHIGFLLPHKMLSDIPNYISSIFQNIFVINEYMLHLAMYEIKFCMLHNLRNVKELLD